jgi:sugar lactone lactonase YvrE
MAIATNPIDNFSVSHSEVAFWGNDLQRPECVLAEPDGSLWTADLRGLVHIRPDGTQRIVTQTGPGAIDSSAVAPEARLTQGSLPNGLAFARNGDVVIANFGTDRLELMRRGDGHTTVIVDTLAGEEIGKVNFVLRDRKDRLWITVSTRIKDWPKAVDPTVADGFVALWDKGSLRIVADDICFTNECRLDAKEEWLYVVETCGCRVTKFRVGADGSLSDRQPHGPKDHGAFIDGIAFDAHGNLWGTHVMYERIFAITPDGDLRIILEDLAPNDAGARLIDAFRKRQASFDLMQAAQGKLAGWYASVTFGGPDLENVYIGSLLGKRLPTFRSPVAGLPMVHWAETA